MAFIDKDNLTIVTRQARKGKNIVPKIIARIRVYVPAGEAKPVAPLGPVLGQHGINMMEFCKKFNEESLRFEPGLPLSVLILKKSDNTFEFRLSLPNFSFFLWLVTNEGSGTTISSLEAYDLVRIEAVRHKLALQDVARIVFGKLKSTKIRMRD